MILPYFCFLKYGHAALQNLIKTRPLTVSHDLSNLPSGDETGLQVDITDFIPVIVSDVGNRFVTQNASVIDQNVNLWVEKKFLKSPKSHEIHRE